LNREKIFRWLVFLLTALVVVLLFRFRPRIEGPSRLETPAVTSDGVTLSGRNFRYEEKQGDQTKYVVTAEEVRETSRVEKELVRPVVTVPKDKGAGDTVTGEKGTLSLSRQEVRIYGDARIAISGGMTMSSSAFRLTPQGEVVSEGRVGMAKEGLTGAADILRYDRERRVAHLEGNVVLGGADTSFGASRIKIDFNSHAGEIEGPVLAIKGDSRLEAPRGTLTLDKDNRLSSVTLLTPSRGETPAAVFDSQSSDYLFDKGGAVSEVVLRGKVGVARKGEAPGRVETELLSLTKRGGEGWNWSAPGKMDFFRGDEKMTAASGAGIMDGSSLTGDLQGPVRGADASGEFSADAARIGKDSFELIGNAQAARESGTVNADNITFLKDGGKKAEGSVRGRSVSGKGEIFLFSADRVRMGKSAYPVKLSGNVRVYSDRIDFRGEEATFLSPRAMKACRGASVSAEGKGSPVFLYGSELSYDEESGILRSSGDPSATDGKSRLSASESIEIFFDRERKAEKLVLEGSAIYESDTYSAKGDRIIYFPKEKKGEAVSDSGKAVVTEKAPLRVVTGRKIGFGDKELHIGGEKGEVHRGKIEGEELKRKADGEGHP